MAQFIRRNPSLTFGLCLGMTALSGCTVFGHEINNGIWFPILIVVSFIVFVFWLFNRHKGRRSSGNRPSASGWADGDASGHGGHTQMHDDHGGDDGGGHHG